MVSTAAAAPESDPRPTLWHDGSFHAMNVTQFLGAFNDNLFKQLVLLICVDYLAETGINYQTIALFLFAFPFVLFSGFAGYLADRMSKRRIVVAMKVAEILVMFAGFLAFHATYGRIEALLAVVFCMGTHSAFFGPSKYGILPELFRESDLPRVNGMIQMTTFLSIIFGWALGSFTKQWYGDRLWVGSALCMGIAVLGTLTALFVRRTPIARPGLEFTPSSLFMSGETWRMLVGDRPLFAVLLISSLFWFLGGVVQPLVNDFGKLQLQYGDARTGMMGLCTAVGIMVGCLSAGKASKGRIRPGFVTLGSWGIVVCLAGIAALASDVGVVVTKSVLKSSSVSVEHAAAEESAPPASLPGAPPISKTNEAASRDLFANESLIDVLNAKSGREWIFRGLLMGVGVFAGFFIVPLAVFMQVRPPKDKKGRMIGAMNLVNWIGILIAAVFYGLLQQLLAIVEIRESWLFAISALVLLPVALFYRPKLETVSVE